MDAKAENGLDACRRCVAIAALVTVSLTSAITVFAKSAHALSAEELAGLNIGRLATSEEVAAWNIDVFPDGAGYPPGKGSVAAGARLYQTACLACHGVDLEGGGPGLGPALAGGQGSLATEKPLKTIGSYWPYASTVFDYVRRTMPFQAPQSLSNDEVYSLTAYILHRNGILPEGAEADAAALARVRMPNAAGFYVDDRPDAQNLRCMQDCPVP